MIRIAIVEDHEIVRDALASFLADTPDIEVVAMASSLRDALPLLEQHRPQVVLADLRSRTAMAWSWSAPLAESGARHVFSS